jgi:hypothetical protein
VRERFLVRDGRQATKNGEADFFSETVLATLHDHFEMIDMNPLVIDRRRLPEAPSYAEPDETKSTWYEITDIIEYLPGGLAKGKVSYCGCFHDMPDGLQTHIHAPMGLELRSRWKLGGVLPGEPPEAIELGLDVPRTGLYLREDVEMKCNIILTPFVKKTLKKAHHGVVAHMIQKAESANVSTTGLGGAPGNSNMRPTGYASSQPDLRSGATNPSNLSSNSPSYHANQLAPPNRTSGYGQYGQPLPAQHRAPANLLSQTPQAAGQQSNQAVFELPTTTPRPSELPG